MWKRYPDDSQVSRLHPSEKKRPDSTLEFVVLEVLKQSAREREREEISIGNEDLGFTILKTTIESRGWTVAQKECVETSLEQKPEGY